MIVHLKGTEGPSEKASEPRGWWNIPTRPGPKIMGPSIASGEIVDKNIPPPWDILGRVAISVPTVEYAIPTDGSIDKVEQQ